MFHVCMRSISGKRSDTVLFDLDREVTWRYDLSEIAAAIAACGTRRQSEISSCPTPRLLLLPRACRLAPQRYCRDHAAISRASRGRIM